MWRLQLSAVPCRRPGCMSPSLPTRPGLPISTTRQSYESRRTAARTCVDGRLPHVTLRRLRACAPDFRGPLRAAMTTTWVASFVTAQALDESTYLMRTVALLPDLTGTTFLVVSAMPQTLLFPTSSAELHIHKYGHRGLGGRGSGMPRERAGILTAFCAPSSRAGVRG